MATCMYSAAPYVPEQLLWGIAWIYAAMIANLQPSRVPNSNISRCEEFTNIRPDLN
jgi:hypothetical protein